MAKKIISIRFLFLVFLMIILEDMYAQETFLYRSLNINFEYIEVDWQRSRIALPHDNKYRVHWSAYVAVDWQRSRIALPALKEGSIPWINTVSNINDENWPFIGSNHATNIPSDWIRDSFFLTSIAISLDGNYLAVGSFESHTHGKPDKDWAKAWLNLYSLQTKKKILTLHESNEIAWGFPSGDYICSLNFSPDGRFLVSCQNKGKIVVWSIPEGRILASTSGYGKFAIFSPDGNWIAIGTDKKFNILNRSLDNQVTTFIDKKAKLLCFSASDYRLVGAVDKKILTVWDMLNGQPVKILPHPKALSSATIGSKCGFLFSGSEDGLIRIFESKTLTEVGTFEGHRGGINMLLLSPDEQFLYSTGNDKTLKIWDIGKFRSDLDLKNRQIAEMKAEELRKQRSLPSKLVTTIEFNDRNSYFPNNALEAGEKAELLLKVKNDGQGPGFDVEVGFSADNSQVIIPLNQQLGEIPANETKHLTLAIQANLEAVDGTVTINIETKEKRGYDARPVQIQIPVRHLDKPALSFTSFTLNDGTSGMANGNGNGIVENGETVEITAYVKNTGVGASLNTLVNLNSVSPGAEIRQGKARLGTIAPTETKQAKVVVAIPRTYSGSDLRLSFAARDTIGASQITKEHILPMSKLAPILAFDSRFLDSRGVQVDEVSNGNDYILEIVPRNEGQIAARSVQANITASTAVNLSNPLFAVGEIAAGATAAPIRFNFSFLRNYKLGIPLFNLRLSQTDFSDVNQKLDIPFRLKSPNLIAREVVTTSDGNSDIQQSETVDIDIVVENQGDLDAENVVADLNFTHTGIDFRERSKTLGRIPAGGQKRERFSFLVKTGAAVGPLFGQLQVSQADDFAPVTKTLNYAINAIGAEIVTVTTTEQPTAMQRVAPVVRANTPPVVFLSLKNLGAEGKSYDPFVKLEIQIRDDKPLLAIEPEIRVNGKLQPKEQGLRGIDLQERESKELDQKLRLYRHVELSEGFNNIEVRIYDADNEMGFETAQVEYVAQRTDILALVIGVGQYHYSVDPLKYAAADAQSFHDFLRSPEGGGLPSDRIRLLLNKEATRENIINSMEWLASKAFENDLVIIYLATHGMVDQGELYFVGYNTDPRNLLATGIKKSDLDIIQRRLKSNKVVWFADACHSGSLGEDPNVTMRANRASATNRLLSEIAKARNGLAMFLSAQSTEFSQESDKWGGGHGVFTWYLLQGLRGQADRNRDNLITITELFEYVSTQVNEVTEGKQSPTIYGNFDRTLPLSTVK